MNTDPCALWFTEYKRFAPGNEGQVMFLSFPDEGAALDHWQNVRANIDRNHFLRVDLCDDDENVIRQLFPVLEQQP